MPHVIPSGAAPRPQLPTDPSGLEAMGMAFEVALEAGLAELELLGSAAASPPARASYEAHARLLRDWNQAINLTAIRDPAQVAWRHVLDALSAVPQLTTRVAPGATLLDLGSGGGYPGLPLAAALPWGRVCLLDSVGKKARFLGVAGAAVSAILAARGESGDGPPSPGIEAVGERAEDMAEEWGYREAWDVVTARAVGPLAEVLELGLPLAREGGLVVAWKREGDGAGLRRELEDAGSIMRATGAARPQVVAIEASGLPGHRLVLVPKVRPTPASYPRPAGIRRRRV